MHLCESGRFGDVIVHSEVGIGLKDEWEVEALWHYAVIGTVSVLFLMACSITEDIKSICREGGLIGLVGWAVPRYCAMESDGWGSSGRR